MFKWCFVFDEICWKCENKKNIVVKCYIGNKCVGVSVKKNFRLKIMYVVDLLDKEFFFGLLNVNGDNYDVERYEIVKMKNINIYFIFDIEVKCNVLLLVDFKKIDKNFKVVLIFLLLK